MKQCKAIPKISELEINNDYPANDILLNQALEVVNDFIRFFQKKAAPLVFMYEADIQSHIAFKLRKVIPPITFVDKNGTENCDNINQLSLINYEYPVRKRFDIACINPRKIREYVGWKNLLGDTGVNTIFWELPLLFAMEIKYCLYGYKTGLKNIKADYDKMKKYNDSYHKGRNNGNDPPPNIIENFKFLALLFFQDQERYEQEKQNMICHEVVEINDFNSIYLISFKKILKVDSFVKSHAATF